MRATSSLIDRDVQFENGCPKEVQGDLMRGHALLHSIFCDEAIAVLNGVATRDANCAMAHWGGGDGVLPPALGPVGDDGPGRSAETTPPGVGHRGKR